MQAFELEPPAGDLLGHVFRANEVRTGFAGLVGLGALRKREDADRFSQAVREHHGAAHVLIALLGVDAEIDGHLDRFVELCRLVGLQEFHRLAKRVFLCLVDLGPRGLPLLAVTFHV